VNYKVALINPPLVHVTGDPFGDIPFMPTGITYLAGYLLANGVDVSIVDGFGLAPRQVYRIDDQLSATGLTEDEIIERLTDENLVGISVHSGMSHSVSLRLAAQVRDRLPDAVLIAGGNHASAVYDELIEGGFDYVCIGEGEDVLLDLVRCRRDGRGDPHSIPGLAYRGGVCLPNRLEPDLDKFGFAALELLPLDNYWSLGMQHAPVKGRYMVITTSRGCPFNCRFCTTPKLLGRRWRHRSPKHVVDEIQADVDRFGIEEVTIQDELFGCRKEVAQAIAREILDRNLQVRLSLPSGVKAESFDEETLSLLRQAGLEYMCLAPESGSERVLDRMNKPVDFDRFYRVVAFARRLGIRLGCFFVLGFEDENDDDRRLTMKLIRELTRMGVDEVSIFIWTPLPGADAFESETGWSRYEDLNWSPAWRTDYRYLARFRRRLYLRWFFTKAMYHPVGLLRSAWNVVSGRYELKSEMALRRLILSMFRVRTGPKQ